MPGPSGPGRCKPNSQTPVPFDPAFAPFKLFYGTLLRPLTMLARVLPLDNASLHRHAPIHRVSLRAENGTHGGIPVKRRGVVAPSTERIVGLTRKAGRRVESPNARPSRHFVLPTSGLGAVPLAQHAAQSALQDIPAGHASDARHRRGGYRGCPAFARRDDVREPVRSGPAMGNLIGRQFHRPDDLLRSENTPP